MKTTPFWKIDQRGKIEIDERLLVYFLIENGFATYYPVFEMTTEPQFLNKNGNIIELISPLWIHKTVISGIESGIIDKDILPHETKNALVSELIDSKILTKKEVIVLLRELDKPIVSDTKDSAYFFFRNTGVLVTKDEIKPFPLETLNEYVWKSQIIDRDFVLRDYDEIEKKSEYCQFLKNISSLRSDEKCEFNKERFDNLVTLQGYLLHGYKDKANAKAVILMDASEIGEPNGRTGKGLLVEGISYLKKTIKEDGKSFKDDNRFKFSQVTPDTKILFMNDVNEKFNFENFFPTITEGIIVEPKFVNKFEIPFKDSPKIVISTNYAVLGRGSSFEARKHEFELSNYYSEEHTPIKEFGHLFFDEWDPEQWSLFDSLMMHSLKEYLNKGVTKSKGINLMRNKLIAETSRQFFDWVTGYGIIPNHKYAKKPLYEEYTLFCEKFPDVSQLVFTKFLKIWAHSNNLIPEEKHSNDDRSIEFRSK